MLILMEAFSIVGGKRLAGEIQVLGSKNSALPILAACLLNNKKCEIDNLPKIEDISILIDILSGMGAQISWTGERRIRVKTDDIEPEKIDHKKVRKLRGSILILGPVLARFGKVEMNYPGGCYIGARPLTSHFSGFRSLGAVIEEKGDKYFVSLANYKGGEAVLPEFSVTATENLLLFASFFPYKTVIKMAACEPSIIELAQFLKKMGAEISGEGTHTIIIKGPANLKEANHAVWPDSIEAGTFITLGSLKGEIKVLNAPISFLDMPFQRLKESNVDLEIFNRRFLHNSYEIADVFVKSPSVLKAVKIQTLPYPGFPTDLQPIFCALLTQAQGASLIQEYLYEGRFRYIEELKKMGANANILDTHRVLIVGPTALSGWEVNAGDLRSGIALVIAALIADGKSLVKNIGSVDRGYEKIEERLQKLGADIKRISNYSN